MQEVRRTRKVAPGDRHCTNPKHRDSLPFGKATAWWPEVGLDPEMIQCQCPKCGEVFYIAPGFRV